MEKHDNLWKAKYKQGLKKHHGSDNDVFGQWGAMKDANASIERQKSIEKKRKKMHPEMKTDREKAIGRLKSKSLGKSSQKEMTNSMNSMRSEPNPKVKKKPKSLGRSTEKEMLYSANSMRKETPEGRLGLNKNKDDNSSMYDGEK